MERTLWLYVCLTFVRAPEFLLIGNINFEDGPRASERLGYFTVMVLHGKSSLDFGREGQHSCHGRPQRPITTPKIIDAATEDSNKKATAGTVHCFVFSYIVHRMLAHDCSLACI